MRLGLALPRTSDLTQPNAVRRLAGHAEALGFQSLWTADRLLSPISHRGDEAFLDPVGALHIAAASTTKIALAAVLVAPWHSATVLCRALTTLDLASEGRLTVALTTGCSVDEYDAAGVPVSERTDRMEETIDVFEAAWRAPVVAYEGRRVRIAPSTIEPKPAQRPRPAILLGGTRVGSFDRVARRGDGWLAAYPAVDPVQGWATVRRLAADHGRDPARLRLVVHLDLGAPGERSSGSVARGVEAAHEAGAHELVVGFLRGHAPDGDRLGCLEALIHAVHGSR